MKNKPKGGKFNRLALAKGAAKSPEMLKVQESKIVDQSTSRTKAILAYVLAGVVAIGAGTALVLGKEIDEDKKETGHVQEKVERIGQLKMGNVTFVFPAEMSDKDTSILNHKMKSAYKKLSDYFGEQVVTFKEDLTFPVIIASNGHEKGHVNWTYDKMVLEKDGSAVIKEYKPEELTLKTVNDEAVIAHELFHLFVERMSVGSVAFYEGHAYAIENELYPGSLDGELYDYLGDTKVDKILNFGMDFTAYDQQVLHGGIPAESDLYRLAQHKMAKEWGSFMATHRDFFKKFYQETYREREKGKISFSKDELIEIANRVEADFAQWYGQESNPIRDLETKSIQAAIKISGKAEVLLINIQTQSRKVEGNQMTPGWIKLAQDGPVKMIFSHASKREITDQTIELNENQKKFIIFDLPNLRTDPQMKLEAILVGGQEIPLY